MRNQNTPVTHRGKKLPYNPRIDEDLEGDFYSAVYGAYEAGFPVTETSVGRQARYLDAAAQKAKIMREAARKAGQKQASDKLAFNVAALLLLRDLIQIGWTLTIQGTNIELYQKPLSDDIKVAKQQIRASMLFERKESLRGDSVKVFIRDMEKERPVQGQARSIFSLIADGRCLHQHLAEIAELSEEEKYARLWAFTRPYLQLVDGNQRDEFTSLRLIDIWRYFRLTWSTPYRHTPGRNVFYLIRDEAQPCHPVIGIAALSNCIIGIRCRDDKIGWTTEAIADQLVAAKAEDDAERAVDANAEPDYLKRTAWEIAEMLQTALESGLADIAIDDITTRNEVAFPSEEGVAAIWRQAEDATQERYRHLKEEALVTAVDGDILQLELTDPPAVNPVTRDQRESSAALFRRKRASKLAALLQAKLLCQKKNVFENPTVGLPALLWSDREWRSKYEAGRSCIRTMLNANKDTKIGSNMMEITVCGAIAPYNMLLGGKLVAMLLTSPQVACEYQARYGQQVSTIASQVAGRDITREASLVFLGTSSLYVDAGDKEREEGRKRGEQVKHSSASQYNRIRIPADIAGGCGEVKYECLGMTEGYGVVHFSTDTREALEELDIIKHAAKRVNSLFGEGTSPRLRKIRQGISLLGLSDEFLVHGQKRLVYGINLAHNTERYLRGIDREPDYIFPAGDDPKTVSDQISQFWQRRWLSVRINHEPTMTKLAAFTPSDFAVSKEYGEEINDVPADLGI